MTAYNVSLAILAQVILAQVRKTLLTINFELFYCGGVWSHRRFLVLHARRLAALGCVTGRVCIFVFTLSFVLLLCLCSNG